MPFRGFRGYFSSAFSVLTLGPAKLNHERLHGRAAGLDPDAEIQVQQICRDRSWPTLKPKVEKALAVG